MDELKLALAQVDRVRRNAHDQAESHEPPWSGCSRTTTSRAPTSSCDRHIDDAETSNRGPATLTACASLARWAITSVALALAAQ